MPLELIERILVIEIVERGPVGPSGSSHWDDIEEKPASFPASAHTHDDRYYTESEVDSALAGKSSTSHGHGWDEIDGPELTVELVKTAGIESTLIAGIPTFVFGSDSRCNSFSATGSDGYVFWDMASYPVIHRGTLRRPTLTEDIVWLLQARGGTIADLQDITDHASATDPHGDRAYADGLVVGLVDDRGNFDASVNTWPTGAPSGSDLGGSGTANAILKGDLWTVSVAATSGPLNGYGVGVVIRAMVDAPGQTSGNWAITAAGYGYVPENSANKSSDVGADQASTTKYPTVKAIYDWVVSALSGKADSSTLTAHTGNTTNPHSVTKAQVGLSAVDNTADADKPISSLTQTALNGKAPTNLVGSPFELCIAFSDETTAITAGTGKVAFRMPFAGTLNEVILELTTAQTSGSIFTADVNKAGTSILSTKLTVDNTEDDSTTAATAAVISDATFAKRARFTVDVDQIGDGTAKGGKIWLIGTRA